MSKFYGLNWLKSENFWPSYVKSWNTPEKLELKKHAPAIKIHALFSKNIFCRKLHENEQILRSELTEKRELLAKLRQELEYTRETWNVVKVKTADSEREWHALRAEFAARRKLFKSAYHLCSGGRLTDLEEDCDGPGKVKNKLEKKLGLTRYIRMKLSKEFSG